MPYNKLTELPDKIRNNLPHHAQDIYMKAFNNAWEQYKTPEKRKDKESSREETAHRVAWSAVKKEYEKVNGEWEEK